MRDLILYTDWLTPLYFLAGGLLAGLLFDRIIMARVKKFAARTRWQADDLVVESLRGSVILWIFLASVYFALQSLPLTPRVDLISTRLLSIAFILSLTVVAARIAGNLVTHYSGRSEGLIGSSSIFRNLAKLFVFILGVLVILQTLGIRIGPVLTALGVGGLAIALALQDTLNNLFAGLHIIASRQVRIGDFVRLEDGNEGFVEDIRWRNTTIRNLPNNMIIVPNSKLASAVILNYNIPAREMGFGVQMGVAYDSDLDHVERVCVEVGREVMQQVEGGVPDGNVFVGFHTFGDSAILFSVNLRAKEFVNHYRLKSEFIRRIHKRFKQEGIEIPFPVRRVLLEQETEAPAPPSK